MTDVLVGSGANPVPLRVMIVPARARGQGRLGGV